MVLLSYLGGTLDGVELDANLTVPSGSTLAVENGLVLNSTLTVCGNATLAFAGMQTLSGTGQVLGTSSVQGWFELEGSQVDINGTQDQPAVLTVAAGMTIHGQGYIEGSYGSVLNQGAILRGCGGNGHLRPVRPIPIRRLWGRRGSAS